MELFLSTTLAKLCPILILIISNLLEHSKAQSMTTIDVGQPSSITSSQSTSRDFSSMTLTTSISIQSANSTNNANATATSLPTNGPALFPDSSYHTPGGAGVFNYYFLILAVFGVVLAVLLWWARRQRIRRKEQMRRSGRDALARDMDGWVTTRGWLYGRRRHNQAAGVIRREEGLDENGEAPPPYLPKLDASNGQDSVSPARDASTVLALPMRTLSRDRIELVRPPEYQEDVAPPAPSGSTTSLTDRAEHTSSPRSINPLPNRPDD